LIGSFDDLNAASVGDVAKFFRTYYAPDNAALVIVGDIREAEAKKLIETYFGDIPSQPQPKHPDLTEPADFRGRTEVYKDPLAKVPGVVIGYPGPKRRSPDFYALSMIDAILTGGDSSRFRQDLMKGKQSVIQYEANLGWPFASSLDYRDPGPYAMFLLYNPKFTGKQIVEQVQEEITRLQTKPVDAKELERVRTQFRAVTIRSLQGAMGSARMLAQYAITDGDPKLINTELDRVMAVTPEQIQAAAKRYFVSEKRVVLEIAPTPNTASGVSAPKEEK